MEWKNIYRGILMGISDLIPGVSGSTIAIILGIYDKFLDSINMFFSRNWKRSLNFLIPLGIGIVITLLVFSKLIKFLLHNYHQPTQFFFLGLIIGVIPMLFKVGKVKSTFTAKEFVVLAIAAIIVAAMNFITPSEGLTVSELTLSKVFFLFVSGWMASMAMLLPGISGSFVLVLLGVYSVAIDALATLNLAVIAIIGAGVIIGFVFSSKGIRYLLQHHFSMTYAAIIGLVLGSLLVIYPGIPESTSLLITSFITFTIGYTIVSFLNKQS